MKRLVVLMALLVLWPSAVANATVTLTPTRAKAAQAIDFVFSVGNSTQAASDKVTIVFPDSPTVAAVQASSPPGWSSLVYAGTGTVSSVVFTSGTIAAGASADFTLTFPPPAISGLMTFKIQQGYQGDSTTPPDTASITIDADGVATTTTVPAATSSTTTATEGATATTIAKSAAKKSAANSIGEVLVAVGVAVGVVFYLRIRRKK